ncbi:MAG: tetratricopeptide repeat protein [Candidatus Zixiibacteriota bacterium]
MNRLIKLLVMALVLMLGTGCVYYNTFYLARKAFNDAESKRKSAKAIGGKVATGQYKTAIEKTEKVIDKHPNSKYYDDALFVNGVSHYYIEDYGKASKRFRELLANFPKSSYYKESQLYLAKSKLRLGDEEDAMALFEELFMEVKDKGIKSEAAMALGEYNYEKKDYAKAIPYFMSVIDSLGNNEEKIVAKMYIADGQFSRFRYKDAIITYEELSKDELSRDDSYKVKFRLGECNYYTNNIEKGMEYFNELAGDELYYDSLPSVKMMLAQGYEWQGDMLLAEDMYDQVAVENPRHPKGALANYYLGLLYQNEYEDYKKAKEYYDKAKAVGGTSEIYQDALEHSTNIGKLEEYLGQKDLDSTATEKEIDKAGETQYLLAELYLTKLEQPDSAMQEFRYVSTKFPTAYVAPKAQIALALMERDYYDDTLKFDSILRNVINDYPRSDFLPEALDLLGLRGTRADTGYAELYFKKAEKFAFDDSLIDSAMYYYQYVADSFPRSSYNIQAKYALLWTTETFMSPGDSSLYFAYAYFADSFPNTEYGKVADKKLTVKPRIIRETGEDEDSLFVDAEAGESGDSTLAYDDDTTKFLTPEEKYFIGPSGTTLFQTQGEPSRFDREFRYPPAAYYTNFEGYLYFQVKIDAFGRIEDLRLMNPTPSEELNEEATETVLSAEFPTFWITAELVGSWFVYKYYIPLPSDLR